MTPSTRRVSTFATPAPSSRTRCTRGNEGPGRARPPPRAGRRRTEEAGGRQRARSPHRLPEAHTANLSTQDTLAPGPGARAPLGTRAEGGSLGQQPCPWHCAGHTRDPLPFLAPAEPAAALNVQTSNREEPNTHKVLSPSCTDEINTLVLGGGSPGLFASPAPGITASKPGLDQGGESIPPPAEPRVRAPQRQSVRCNPQ